MATFEFTAKHPIILGPQNNMMKGEKLIMNIHTLGVQPFNVLSNPESRRQVIQQFAVNGIDASSRPGLLNYSNWDIKRVPERSFAKSIDSFKPFMETNLHSYEHLGEHDVVDDVEMKKSCIELVKDFYDDGIDMAYAENGLEGRCEIAYSFYNDVKEKMGIDSDLEFVEMEPYKLGGYNYETNSIELNSNYLENSDSTDLLNTILHESRHAFQNKCIVNPESVTVKGNIIDVWKDNMDHYINPAFDQEAYENQEVEKDANYFADSVMKKGMDYNFV